MVGNVPVGGDAPISVQSMTNTSTADVTATVEQIKRIQAAGADIVRVSVPSLDEAEVFGQIRRQVADVVRLGLPADETADAMSEMDRLADML